MLHQDVIANIANCKWFSFHILIQMCKICRLGGMHFLCTVFYLSFFFWSPYSLNNVSFDFVWRHIWVNLKVLCGVFSNKQVFQPLSENNLPVSFYYLFFPNLSVFKLSSHETGSPFFLVSVIYYSYIQWLNHKLRKLQLLSKVEPLNCSA